MYMAADTYMQRIWNRLRGLIVSKVLGLEDTPHRIALGVFLGFLIAWTPTLGLQIIMYLAISTLIGANRLSGLPAIFISNPATAVPVYYSAWVVGHFTLEGTLSTKTPTPSFLDDNMSGTQDWRTLLTLEFWEKIAQLLFDKGLELWVGALVLGIFTGGIGYILAYRGVVAYRRRKLHLSQQRHDEIVSNTQHQHP